MGFDVYGLSPKSEKGVYFRNGMNRWRALSWLVLEECDVPDDEKEYWNSNSGQEVSGQTASHIADHLKVLLDSGYIKEYESARNRWLETLPDEKCDLCCGNGYRHDEYVDGICNGCKGKGTVRPYATHYPFSEENVRGFMEFCRDSGGFRIS